MRQRQWKPRGRLARALRRSSVAWWTGAVALGLVTASVVSTNMSRASQAAQGWGTQEWVWVMRRSVPAGATVETGDVARERRPARVIPQGALDGSASPIGEASRVALVPGEVVLTARLAGRGAAGLAALVGPGQRAISMRSDESTPTVRPGDRVDVIATFDVGDGAGADAESGPNAPSFAVATNAEVVMVSARAVTLAVTSREAPRVAFALARAAVTLAVRG